MNQDSLARELAGRYRIDAVLGQGGMGVVYHAHHLALDRGVAIKVLHRSAAKTDIGARLAREARIAARITSPHVVTVHDFGFLSDGAPFMVMELVDGPSLSELVKRGPVPLSDVRTYMLHAARGMSAAAEIGSVHRDLKPANMLIAPSGELKIADFGLARVTETEGSAPGRPLTKAGMLLGTPYYIAPEQVFDARGADTRSDIYSYGASFYEAATGQKLFPGRDLMGQILAHQMEIPARPRSIRADVPEDIEAVLERCLAKEASHRYPAFEEVEAALVGHESSPWDARPDAVLAEYAAHYQRVRADLLAGGPPGPVTAFRFEGGRALSIVRTDIAGVVADALVSSDDNHLTMSAGVAAALNRGSGGVCFQETRKFVPVRHGGVVVSSAGMLPARFVLHAITLDRQAHATYRPTRDLIARLLEGCFYHADTLRLRSLGLPLLGTGTAGFSPGECLDTMVSFLVKRLLRAGTAVEQVTLVLLPTQR
jgi:eukaryotic-like serine/threonine-protein kinase